ncbi:hypothetical protein [Salinisphaera sp. G21_0]|uniref:hypothetical protein n=1 Tax=Salinisphaera sp. G21_0 TaxID=2821094 RepID=UPI001AD99EE8|nr:hypothetical protein [Salinisphaera sp. G21_0]MBO9481231.1 hypothetical protein [Salinisphaera sp. G21_0]
MIRDISTSTCFNTDAPPTYQEAIDDSLYSIEQLAKKFILNAEAIRKSKRGDIRQCQKSLFARMVKQLNERIPRPFILPTELSVLTNPKDFSHCDWKEWQDNVDQKVFDQGYDAIEEIGDKIGSEDTAKLLFEFLPSLDPEYYDFYSVTSILDKKRPFQQVAGLMRGRCIPAKDFIMKAISMGLVEEELVNKIYAWGFKDQASSVNDETPNNQLPDYNTSCNQPEVASACDLAGEFITTAITSGRDTDAGKTELMHQFTSYLNETHRCNIRVIGVNPGQFGKNPTQVIKSDWSNWQKAVYQEVEKNKTWIPRNEKTIDKVENILLKSNLDFDILYTVFQSNPDILDLNFKPEKNVRYSEDLLKSSFMFCGGACQPVTKIITGLIESGCLTKKTINKIYSLGIKS